MCLLLEGSSGIALLTKWQGKYFRMIEMLMLHCYNQGDIGMIEILIIFVTPTAFIMFFTEVKIWNIGTIWNIVREFPPIRIHQGK